MPCVPFRRSRHAAALVAIGLLTLVACKSGKPDPVPEPETIDGPVWFEDVTDRVGVNFTHDPGPGGKYFMPEIMGSGAALFDYDGDGRLDILLLQNAGPKSASKNRLFHQKPDGTFEDTSAGTGLDVAGHWMGVAIGDVNNDGKLDVFLSGYGAARLFLTRGAGKFEDITRGAGVDSPLWGTSAAFIDFDRDGRLDLVVTHYVDYEPGSPCPGPKGHPDYCHPKTYPGSVTTLYRNLGSPDGRFADVTLSSGLAKVPGPGLGVVCFDADGDGWPDIFIANDTEANRLWINQKNGTFKDEALARGAAYNGLGQAPGNMGIALADVNGDGFLDFFVTHITEEYHTLWQQGPRGSFTDRTAEAGLTRPKWRGTGFGCVFTDFDNSGWPHLAIVNGRMSRPGVAPPGGIFAWSVYAERNQLFQNDGTGKFRDISPANSAFCGTANVGRGLAVGDIDNDGAPDLLVTSVAGKARIYRNVAPARGHWLQISALDPKLKRDAYGAVVTVKAAGREQVMVQNPASSYLCSNDPRLHFGLGASASFDSIRVQWPDGTREVFAGGAADRHVTLTRGAGKGEP
jgi:enediyne biosynthesis protein E4